MTHIIPVQLVQLLQSLQLRQFVLLALTPPDAVCFSLDMLQPMLEFISRYRGIFEMKQSHDEI